MPRRRARHLAAVVGGRRRQDRCCASPAPMPASASSSVCRSRAWKGSRSRSRAWSRRHTSTRPARGVTAAMVSRGEKPVGHLRDHEIPDDRAHAPRRQRRHSTSTAAAPSATGRRNYLQSAYQMVPVGITVEGANILTRTLITFAQGALRSHPYLYREIQAGQDPDAGARPRGLRERLRRSRRLFGCQCFRRVLPQRDRRAVRARRRRSPTTRRTGIASLARGSRNFAFVADLTVASLGGGLKTKQKITGRLADALSELYLLACVLKRYEDDGQPAERPAPSSRLAARTASTASRRRCAASSTTSRSAGALG